MKVYFFFLSLVVTLVAGCNSSEDIRLAAGLDGGNRFGNPGGTGGNRNNSTTIPGGGSDPGTSPSPGTTGSEASPEASPQPVSRVRLNVAGEGGAAAGVIILPFQTLDLITAANQRLLPLNTATVTQDAILFHGTYTIPSKNGSINGSLVGSTQVAVTFLATTPSGRAKLARLSPILRALKLRSTPLNFSVRFRVQATSASAFTSVSVIDSVGTHVSIRVDLDQPITVTPIPIRAIQAPTPTMSPALSGSPAPVS